MSKNTANRFFKLVYSAKVTRQEIPDNCGFRNHLTDKSFLKTVRTIVQTIRRQCREEKSDSDTPEPAFC